MEEYNKFLELKDKYYHRVQYIVDLLEANDYLYYYIDNIQYTKEKIYIKTSLDLDDDYKTNYRSIDIPINIFLGTENDIKNFVKVKIRLDNLKRKPENYKNFADIKKNLPDL